MAEKNPEMIAKILLDRLERISADSSWAHQASGIRASLAKTLSGNPLSNQQISELVEMGFQILEKAAGDIPEQNS